MAPENKQKKRKAAASALSPSAKKSKQAIPPAAPNAVVAAKHSTRSATGSSKPRKTAADLMSDDSDSEDGGWAALEGTTQKGKKVARVNGGDKTKKAPAPKKGKNGNKAEEIVAKNGNVKSTEEESISLAVPEDAAREEDDSAEESAEEEMDDQTATLLKGFESSDEEEEEEEEGGEDLKEGQMVGVKIPDEKKTKKRIGALATRDKTTPGVIYLGRIPHGFYEQEMRAYFSQFGTVSRLRLSRNKKTGNSKHFAFIEFADNEVSKIVAETMNNYLLFGHILKCKTVPRDDLEFIEKLFKGAGKKYKPRPAARLHQRALEGKRPEEVWKQKVVMENRKRKALSENLKKKGIDYEFEAPEAGKAEPMDVDEPEAKNLIESVTVKAIETAPVVAEKKGRKGKKVAETVVLEEAITVTATEEVVPEKKGKRGKKAATTVTKEVVTVAEKAAPEKKGKKSKKADETPAAAEAPVEEVVTVTAAAQAAPKAASEKKGKKGKKGKKEVAVEIVEKAVEKAAEAVADDEDGIDEVEVQAVVKKGKSKSKVKSPAKPKSPANKVVKKKSKA